MVQILIKTGSNGQVEELSIIEIQGDLVVSNNEALTNKFMADLHFNKDGTPFLIIGHHLINGKVVNLEKPMVLLKKVRQQISSSNSHLDMSDNANMMTEESISLNQQRDEELDVKTEYIVEAVVRKKILFNKRPRPIVFS